jgi:uncharacterized integral membrane protein (TIGR00698 family)
MRNRGLPGESRASALTGAPWNRVHTLLPGVAFAALVAFLCIKLSDFIGLTVLGFDKNPISSVLVGILIGAAIRNTVGLPPWMLPGIKFTVSKILRLGIICLGIRLSIPEVLHLGRLGLPVILACISSALLLTALFARLLKLPPRLGTLVAVGTSICGVSAIVATAPAIEADEEEVAYAVAVITLFGLFATLVYPYLADVIFGGDAVKAGLFLGTSVHDTSQVTGSALIYTQVFSRPGALETAAVTKLVRNVFMVAVIPLMALRYCRRKRSGAAAGAKSYSIAAILPWFIVGFLVMAAFRSIGDLTVSSAGGAFWFLGSSGWRAVIGSLKTTAISFFVAALTGVGLNTNLSSLKKLGLRPLLAGLAAAATVGLVSWTVITIVG